MLLVSAVLLVLPVDSRSASASETDVPAPLADAVNDALAGWAEFASVGDVAAIQSVFVEGGPQRAQLEKEAQAWTGEDSEPLRFDVRELRLRHVATLRATVWARVEATRVGFKTQTFAWDFDLIRRSGRWKVWTVLAAERPEGDPSTGAPRFEAIPSEVSPTSTTSKPVVRPPELSAVQALAPASPQRNVRLPALSAWIIVLTVVAVALAGYLAPRLDRRTER